MAIEKFTTANECVTLVTDTQRGEKTVVLLHGYLESLCVWSDFEECIKRDMRVIALDIPGHGVSEVVGDVHSMEFVADVVAEILSQQGVKKATIVGHSMGGYVAMAMLERHPEMVEAIVMFHSTPFADSDEKKANREREIACIQAGKKDALAALSPAQAFASDNLKRFRGDIEGLTEQIYMTDDDGICALLRGMMARPDRSKVLAEARIPKLFIFGRKDNYIGAETAERMIEQNPDAQVAWLENSGHMGFIEQEKESAEILTNFINKLQ
ncbi:MAG: alpha/beta hydrolase [Rikenellaceae bacterium]|nr:alpha/beta hydrolase [Rikenellaceae bacterium]